MESITKISYLVLASSSKVDFKQWENAIGCYVVNSARKIAEDYDLH